MDSPQSERKLESEPNAMVTSRCLEAAAECMQSGQLAEAVRLLERAVGQDAEPEVHYRLAAVLWAAGRPADARSVLQALIDSLPQSAPLLPAVYGLCGRCLVESQELEAAVAHLRRWLELQPGQPWAEHLLAAIAPDCEVPERASTGYLSQNFDALAEVYDAWRVQQSNCGAEALGAQLRKNLGEPRRGLRVLDVGCGTGSAGPVAREYAAELHGLDLSPAMLRVAERSGCYDRLIEADLFQHLQQVQQPYDLIVAVDSFTSFGDLTRLFPVCFQALSQTGWLAFSLDEGPLAEEGYYLQPHGGYMHSPQYIIECMGEAGVLGGSMARVELRHELGQPVYALMMAVQRPSPEPSRDC